MRKKTIKFTVVILFIVVSGILYSCQSIPDGGVSEVISETHDTGRVLTDSEVDIKSDDNESDDVQKVGDTKEVSKSDSAAGTVCVYVCGAVKHAGVYTLAAGAWAEAAVKAAGGFSENADTSALNLAQLVSDGQKIDVPEIGEVYAAGEEAEGGAASGNDRLLDINKATIDELMTLPGIGESKAAKIIAYREANGPFASVEALKQVPGIKDGVFEPIKTLICAG